MLTKWPLPQREGAPESYVSRILFVFALVLSACSFVALVLVAAPLAILDWLAERRAKRLG